MQSINGEINANIGIPHGAMLVRFAEAILASDDGSLSDVRNEIVHIMGAEALVDAAAVAGLFNAIDRVADSTGIPMEEAKISASEDLRRELGINKFAAVKV